MTMKPPPGSPDDDKQLSRYTPPAVLGPGIEALVMQREGLIPVVPEPVDSED